MRLLAFCLGLLACGAAAAETIVATRTIRAQSIIMAQDLSVVEGAVVGAVATAEEAIGQEARVTIYAGRPVRLGDIGPPAIIERNQVVTLVFQRGGLQIAADARALGRAGVGDTVLVMNLSSRSSVSGVVMANGMVRVGGPDLSALNR